MLSIWTYWAYSKTLWIQSYFKQRYQLGHFPIYHSLQYFGKLFFFGDENFPIIIINSALNEWYLITGLALTKGVRLASVGILGRERESGVRKLGWHGNFDKGFEINTMLPCSKFSCAGFLNFLAFVEIVTVY